MTPRPLVLVHGFMGGSAQWHRQTDLGADRPLVAVSLPGFGDRADAAPLDRIEGFAQAVLEEVNARGIDRFDLLGHSMGGMVVQDMVRLAPDRIARLVLYGTGAVGVLPGRFETIETSMTRARADGARATARRIAATWFRDGAASPEYPACAAIAERAALPAVLSGLAAMRDWSGDAQFAAIDVPTLVLWGDGDLTYPWVQTERLWRTIPDSRLAVVPDCAHAVHLECPTVFNAIVARFLAQVS